MAPVSGSGFKVQGLLGFRVSGLSFLGCRVQMPAPLRKGGSKSCFCQDAPHPSPLLSGQGKMTRTSVAYPKFI